MSSSVVEIRAIPGGVGVIIEHDDTDSFSRSVQPAATRATGRANALVTLIKAGWHSGGTIWRGNWEHDFELDARPLPARRCRTMVPFLIYRPEESA